MTSCLIVGAVDSTMITGPFVEQIDVGSDESSMISSLIRIRRLVEASESNGGGSLLASIVSIPFERDVFLNLDRAKLFNFIVGYSLLSSWP